MRRALMALGALLMLGAISIGGSGALAQDMAGVAHPAHIHSGTCEELGDVVYPLSDVGADMMMDGTPMAMDMGGSGSAIPVEASVTTVQAALSDIVASEHAINVHESGENIGNYIACGAIGGPMMGMTDLAIGLGALNDSGYSGIAWLHDNGDGSTTVYVFLTQGGGAGTPAA